MENFIKQVLRNVQCNFWMRNQYIQIERSHLHKANKISMQMKRNTKQCNELDIRVAGLRTRVVTVKS